MLAERTDGTSVGPVDLFEKHAHLQQPERSTGVSMMARADSVSGLQARNAGTRPLCEGAHASLDTPTFAAVYEQQLAFVWRSAKRLGIPTDRVDDVVQDVFVIVFRRLRDFRGMSSVRTWLFSILRRVVRDRRRSLRRTEQAEAPWDDSVDVSAGASPDDWLQKRQAARVLHQLLERLDDDHREAFVLAELEQMTAPEIAEATGANLNTVYSRVRTARQDVAQMLRRWQTTETRRVP
jgi:RNA polymerase sigma-70 factor, ECF subfamily